MRFALAALALSAATVSMANAQAVGAVMNGANVTLTRSTNLLHQTNSPVTLVLEHKTVQTLTDGTTITRVSHETFLRDTLGRTRVEIVTEPFNGSVAAFHNVTVEDTVARRTYTWLEGASMRKEYSVREQTAPANGSSLMRTAPPPQSQLGGGAGTPNMMVQPAVGSTSRVVPQTHTEDLGMRDIQGFSCKETKSTTVFPVGFFGNDRPVTSTLESCRSTELLRALESTSTDPRSGTQTTSAVTLTRSEPDASLFQPPAGYTERVQNTVRP